MIREKPAYGAPCNSCGLCCIAAQCPLSSAIFGEQDLCPALEKDGDGLTCGLIGNTADYVPDMPVWGGPLLTEAFALMLGAGLGCDSSGDQPPTQEQVEHFRAASKEQIRRASEGARLLVAHFTA